MRVRTHDQGFVAAAPDRVYAAVADVDGYPRWWPGARVRRSDGGPMLRMGPGPELGASAERHREGTGLFLRLRGRYGGTLEWYLEPFEEGTVVNCFLDLEVPGPPLRARRRVLGLRSAIRRAMVGLKATLE